MLLYEMFEDSKEPTFMDALAAFLPIVMKHLGLEKLPTIHLRKDLKTKHVPSFGQFTNDNNVINVDIENRHPNDVLRTLAHELTHYWQNTQNMLDDESWRTGSPDEDQANAEAGVIMRNFNKSHPEFMRLKPIVINQHIDEGWSKKYKRSIDCSNPKGFSQRAHCQGRKKHDESADYERDMQSDPSNPIPFPKGTTLVNVSDVYDWYKLGMAVPALDKADPRVFNKGVPHTVFAFGSEEEEHRMMPLLKRLGFTLHDIDRPEDYAKAIRASDVVEHLEQYVAENFADGKKPGRKGLAKRSGVDCKQSVTKLRSIAKNSSGERQRMAHWCANMKAGRAK